MSIDRETLKDWVYEAVVANGGSAAPVQAAKLLWSKHGHEVDPASDLFFKWQYDMRWAAMELRKEGRFKDHDPKVRLWQVSS